MGRITLDDVTKRFDDGRIVAVDDVSVEVEDGEFLILVGPSGCGKSTTLRMIAGLETVSEGEIAIGGRRVNELEPRERNIAMVFQNYALYPHMTVEENMGFGLRLSTDLDDDAIAERVAEAAEMMDIEDLLDKQPKELSGGQQQRVALGRAIVRDPDAFLFDEPLSNLDAKLRAHMRTELTRLQHDLDVTSIYVTHDQAEAMTMGDRIAVMNDGRLQQVGTPNEVYDHPANRFVAEFIGSPSMNFVAVEAVDRDDAGCVALVARDDGTSFAYPLDADLADRLDVAPGDRLSLGVRPEDVELRSAADGDDGDDRLQTGTVDVVESMGSDDFVYLRLGSETWVGRAEDRFDLREGATVRFGFDPADVYLFDHTGTTVKSKGAGGAGAGAGAGGDGGTDTDADTDTDAEDRPTGRSVSS